MRLTGLIARGSMKTQQNKLDVTANNIANVNTTGFKKSFVTYKTTVQDRGQDIEGISNMSIPDDHGVSISGVRRDLSTGTITQSNDIFDFAINGKGFFRVISDVTGEEFYTRDGSFHMDGAGILRDKFNRRVDIDTTRGPNFEDQILLYNIKEIDLEAVGENNFQTRPGATFTDNNTNPELFGKVLSGHLENSNVDISEEFTNMIETHRAYSMSSKVFETDDEITNLINNIDK